MSRVSIHAKVLAALGDYLKREPQTIPVQASLRDDLGLDSMATIELLYRVEEAFDFQIPDQDLPGLRTVQDVLAYVETRLSPSTPGPSSVTHKPGASAKTARPQTAAKKSAAPAPPPPAKKPAAKPSSASASSARPKKKR